MDPGIAPSGLFWSIPIPNSGFIGGADAASYSLTNLDLVDSFQFLGAEEVPGSVSFDITWVAQGDARDLRPSSSDPTDPTRVAGVFRDALAVGTFSGQSLTMPGGATFTFSGEGSSEGFWAERGTERNGWFLKR